jgi:hypothetical protein
VVVHSAAIAATSEYFDALINGGMDEAQKKCARFEDVRVEDFVRFVEWAYRGDYGVPGWTPCPSNLWTLPDGTFREGLSKSQRKKAIKARERHIVASIPHGMAGPAVARGANGLPSWSWAWSGTPYRFTNGTNSATADVSMPIEESVPFEQPPPAEEPPPVEESPPVDELPPVEEPPPAEPPLSNEPAPDSTGIPRPLSRNQLRVQFKSRNYIRDLYPKDQQTPVPGVTKPTEQSLAPIFLAHARLYSFAHMRLVTLLEALTLSKLHEALLAFRPYCYLFVGDIVELARYAYSPDHNVPDRDEDGTLNELRRLVVEFIACEVESVGRSEVFVEFLEEGGEFVGDFWRLVGGLIR